MDKLKINECVYFLITDQCVPRVLKPDSKGILYIGKGILDKNKERIGELINTVNETSIQHDAGERYLEIKCKYLLSGLKLGVMLSEDSKKIETDELNKYVCEFGELPPLNRQG